MPQEPLDSPVLENVDMSDTKQDNQQPEPQEEQPEQPDGGGEQVSTLVQTVGDRPFHMSIQTVHNLQLLILTFPRGLTLLMSPSDAKRPQSNGIAQLDVHRKFLPAFGKYLHWITFTFQGTGTNVKAQIMLPSRLAAACNLIQGGASACFINCPFRVPRRLQNNKRRVVRTGR